MTPEEIRVRQKLDKIETDLSNVQKKIANLKTMEANLLNRQMNLRIRLHQPFKEIAPQTKELNNNSQTAEETVPSVPHSSTTNLFGD